MDENLLDLSAWPARPATTTAAPRGGVPPRPVSRRRRSLRTPALVALSLGVGLLLVPLGGCGPALTAWGRDPVPLPADTPPALDDGQARADAEAVRDAQAALVAWRPAAAPAHRSPVVASRTVTVSDVDPDEVAADQSSLERAKADVTRADDELNRLLAEQEQSSDPASYDGQVAAAEEELDRAVATRDEAQGALAAAKARTKTVVVTSSSSPAPVASAAPSTDRAALVRQAAEAKQVQAAHLAARQQSLTAWRADLKERTTQAQVRNAQQRTCAHRAGVPGSFGVVLVALGAGALVWRRVRRA